VQAVEGREQRVECADSIEWVSEGIEYRVESTMSWWGVQRVESREYKMVVSSLGF